MKKFCTALVVVLFGMCAVFSAGIEEDATYLVDAPTEEAVEVQVIALKGPTSMGLVSLMDEATEGPVEGNAYTFSIAGAVDEVTSRLVRGDVDIAAVPANLASVLYNNTQGAVKVLAINTLGVLYIVESGNAVHSLDDLRGKTIFASGKGATPEYALQYLLEEYGIADDVTIEWKSEHAECVAALSQTPGGIAMLPQPFVTTAMVKNPDIRIALDMTRLWDDVQQTSDAPSTLVTGVVVGRTAFLEQNPQAV
ncbi:MAG: ABC transporter substrate-binding protein, partial [Sphaerochaetaceae bacterium]